MFDDATVTVKYRELAKLIEERKELEDKLQYYINKEAKGDLEFDESKYIKALDEIESILSNATTCKQIKTLKAEVEKAIDVYYDVFKIPRQERE